MVSITQYKETRPAISGQPKRKMISSVALMLVLLSLFFSVGAQEKKFNYKISIHGKSVGELSVRQKSSSDSLILDINSSISTRMIFLFTAIAAEKTIFKNGRLKYSYISRQINKGSQTTMETKDMGSVYHSQKKGEDIRVNPAPIYHNMSSLYLVEPLNFQTVYSDMFQDFVKIIFLKTHNYKIILPDGNYNEYYYENGICKQIKVHHSLFTAQMDLISIKQL